MTEERPEHRQAMDWLNEHTDDDINFFLIKMELWQIEGSPLAPKFDVISKPNDWAKDVKKAVTRAGLSDTKIQQLDFWNKFKEYSQSKESKLQRTLDSNPYIKFLLL